MNFSYFLFQNAGADPNITDSNGLTALANACRENRVAIVKTLLNRAFFDMDFNLKDRFGDTTLMHAVRTGNPELVRLLVNIMGRLSIDMDVKNNNDITPFLEAKRFGFDEITGILKQEGKACLSLQICPLIFDELSEDAYQKENIVHADNKRLTSKLGEGGVQKFWVRNILASNRHRQVKSAQEKRRFVEHPNKNNLENNRQMKRERSKSEPKSVERASFVNMGNAESANIEIGIDKKLINGTDNESNNGERLKTESPFVKEWNAGKGNDVTKENGTNNKEDRPKFGTSSAQSQPEIEVSIDTGDGARELAQEGVESGKKMTVKNGWLRRLQNKTPAWKRKLQTNENEEGFGMKADCHGEGNVLQIKRESTLSGGALRKILIDKSTTPVAPRRCTSNLSVYFNSARHPLSRSRPGSAYKLPERGEAESTARRGSLERELTKPRFTYEEVFELCPEMKEDTKRKWYSDLRWMLALKGHQISPTHLPAQPERHYQDIADSLRNESEGSRTGGRISVLEPKRPSLKKRHSTLSPTTFKESRDAK